MSIAPVQPTVVIDLSLDSSDDDHNHNQKRKKSTSPSKSTRQQQQILPVSRSSLTNSQTSQFGKNKDIRVSLLRELEVEASNLFPNSKSSAKKGIKRAASALQTTPSTVSKTTAVSTSDDDNVQIIEREDGKQVASDMPHARDACTIHTFIDPRKSNRTQSNFLNICKNCYCYVCEIPARECSSWSNHFNGNCYEAKWKEERKKHRLTIRSSNQI